MKTKKKYVKTCKKIIKQGGFCEGLPCGDCPFRGKKCTSFASPPVLAHKLRHEAARQYLKKHEQNMTSCKVIAEQGGNCYGIHCMRCYFFELKPNMCNFPCTHEKRLKKSLKYLKKFDDYKKLVVKSNKDLCQQLIDDGYKCTEVAWKADGKITFAHEMFTYCGKDPHSGYVWLPQWLEEK